MLFKNIVLYVTLALIVPMPCIEALEKPLTLGAISDKLIALYKEKEALSEEMSFDAEKQRTIEELNAQLIVMHIEKLEEIKGAHCSDLAACREENEQLQQKVTLLSWLAAASGVLAAGLAIKELIVHYPFIEEMILNGNHTFLRKFQ